MSENKLNAYEDLMKIQNQKKEIGQDGKKIPVAKIIKSMKNGSVCEIDVDGKIRVLSKKEGSPVYIDYEEENLATQPVFNEEETAIVLNTYESIDDFLKTKEETKEEITDDTDTLSEELTIPVGEYKLFRETDGERNFYLINLPGAEDIVNFYRNKSFITSTQRDENDIPFRRVTNLKSSYVLVEVKGERDDRKNYDIVSDIVNLDSTDKLSEVASLFTEESKPISENLFDLVSFGILEGEKASKIEESLSKKLKDTDITQLLEQDNETSSLSWTSSFYKGLRESYGTVNTSKKGVQEDTNTIFYKLLMNQLGLSQEESQKVLNDIQNYYGEIKKNLLGIDKENIDFFDIYEEYIELMNETPPLKKAFDEMIEYRLDVELGQDADEFQRSKMKSEMQEIEVTKSKKLFEEDLLSGNIKFPIEYQASIIDTFEKLKKENEEKIILSLAKNQNIIDISVSKELTELRAFAQSLNDYDNIPDNLKDKLILQKYWLLKQEGVNLFKQDENFINKYISHEILPREYKLQRVLEFKTPKVGESFTIYDNGIYSLVKETNLKKEKDKEAEICEYKIITHLASQNDSEEVIGDENSGVNFDAKLLLKIKEYFRDEKEFDEKIDQIYDEYFMLEHFDSLGHKSTSKKSYTEYIRDNIDSYFSEQGRKALIIKSSNENEISCFYLPKDKKIEDIDPEEEAFTQLIIDSETTTVKEKKYTLEGILKECENVKENNEDKKDVSSTMFFVSDEIVPKLLDKAEKIAIEKQKVDEKEKKAKEGETVDRTDLNNALQAYADDFNPLNERANDNLEIVKRYKELEKKGELAKVQKPNIRPIASYKNTQIELANALNDGNFVVLNNFGNIRSQQAIRILYKTESNNVIEFEVTKKGTKSFQAFIDDEMHTPSDIFKYFNIETKYLKGDELQQLLEDNSGKNTSSYIIESKYKSFIDSFWNTADNKIEPKFINPNPNDRAQVDGNLETIIKESFGRSERVSIDENIDFKFFEDKHGFRTMLKIEKNNEGLYSLHLVRNYSENQVSIKLDNVKFEKGEFIIDEEKSKVVFPKDYPDDRTTEIEDIKGILSSLNMSMEANKLSMETMDNFRNSNQVENQSDFNNKMKDVFRLFESDASLRDNLLKVSETVNTDELILGYSDILQILYETKTESLSENTDNKDKESNLLIDLLSEDLEIKRTDEIDADADDVSKKLFKAIKESKDENSDLKTFREVLSKVVSEYAPELDVEKITDSIYENLRMKVSEEFIGLTSIKTNRDFGNYMIKPSNPLSNESPKFLTTLRACIDSIDDTLKEFSDRFSKGIKYVESNLNDSRKIKDTEIFPIIRFYVYTKIHEKTKDGLKDLEGKTEEDIAKLESLKRGADGYFAEFEKAKPEGQSSESVMKSLENGDLFNVIDVLVETDKKGIANMKNFIFKESPATVEGNNNNMVVNKDRGFSCKEKNNGKIIETDTIANIKTENEDTIDEGADIISYLVSGKDITIDSVSKAVENLSGYSEEKLKEALHQVLCSEKVTEIEASKEDSFSDGMGR